ncbi:MAG: S41 family peptidase [Chloroflexi bacterium]|nr:S41 family peptidase [Chloroflexota bacterium]
MLGKIIRWTLGCMLIAMLAIGLFASGFAVGHVTAGGGSQLSALPLISGKTNTTVTPPPDTGTPPDLQTLFAPFWEAWTLVHKNYYSQPVDDQALVYGAIKGMIQALGDKHSGYMTPAESKINSTSLSGELEGIGATVEISGKYLKIISPIPNSPAEKAGILPGDTVTKVNGEDIAGQDLYTIISKVRGPAGTKVKLLIVRDGESAPLEFEVTRARVIITSVESKMLPNDIAYVKVNEFGAKTSGELQTQLKALMAQKPKGIILDLRNNGGGYVNTAVDVASHFIGRGKVLLIERFGDGREQKVLTQGGGLATELPLVVLINQGSASASEVVTGAIQDYKRGTIIGETSYGKGTGQIGYELSNDQGEARITIFRWLTPNGNWVHEKGITPDIEVKLTKADRDAKLDPQLDAALKALTGK